MQKIHKCSIVIEDQYTDFVSDWNFECMFSRHSRTISNGAGKFQNWIQLSQSKDFNSEYFLGFSPRLVPKFINGRIVTERAKDDIGGYLMNLKHNQDPKEFNSYIHCASAFLTYL